MIEEGYRLCMRFKCCIPCVCREKELRRQQRYRDKSHFEPGVWNVNTVIMGGLGGDSELSSSSDEGMYFCVLQHAREILGSPCTKAKRYALGPQCGMNHVGTRKKEELP